MNTCYKIIQFQRGDIYDTLSFHFFPNKLVYWPTVKRKAKITEHHFESQEEVEAKFESIIKRKLKVGYEEINRIENPKYYNLWRQKKYDFWNFYKDDPKIRMYPPTLDSDGEPLATSVWHKQNFLAEYPWATEELIDFATPLSSQGMDVKIVGDMYYHYRLSIDLFVKHQLIWDSSTEPSDKLTSALGQSVIQFIEKDAGFSYQDEPKRIKYFSKGLFSLMDIKTEKIYAVEDWNPNYHLAVSASNIERHESLEDFYNYIWDRVDHDVGYSLENA